MAPNAAASAVLTATTVKRRSVAAKRRRGVEAEPTEQQDERAQHRHRDAVRRQRARLAVGSVLADPGTEHDRTGQGGDATHRVHHTGAGEVDVAEPEVEVVAELAEPAAAPGPPTEDRVVERAAEQAPADERLPLPALGHRAGRNGRGGVHERDHVEEERRDRNAVRDAGEREAAPAPQERPVTEADQPIGAQRRVEPEIPRVAEAAEHDREPHDEERRRSRGRRSRSSCSSRAPRASPDRTRSPPARTPPA